MEKESVYLEVQPLILGRNGQGQRRKSTTFIWNSRSRKINPFVGKEN